MWTGCRPKVSSWDRTAPAQPCCSACHALTPRPDLPRALVNSLRAGEQRSSAQADGARRRAAEVDGAEQRQAAGRPRTAGRGGGRGGAAAGPGAAPHQAREPGRDAAVLVDLGQLVQLVRAVRGALGLLRALLLHIRLLRVPGPRAAPQASLNLPCIDLCFYAASDSPACLLPQPAR